MSSTSTPPRGTQPCRLLDPTTAHSARVYDYWLGGKDNYAADRRLADAVLTAVPHQRRHIRANRDFMARVVNHLVRDLGIRQIIDVGAGMPSDPNVHEVAYAAAPQTRVVYVDADPVVMAHARAIMPMGTDAPDSLGFVCADLRDPGSVLDGAEREGRIDLSRPVAVLVLATLMLVPDSADPYGVMARLVGGLAPGSHLVATHDTADFAPSAATGHADAALAAGIPFRPRSRAEFTGFFAGTELLEPGVVPVTAWGSRPLAPSVPSYINLYAGVGRVPTRSRCR